MSTQKMDSNPQAAFPSLCSNGCGFFSTTDKEGLCSVCYKEKKIKKETETATQSPPTTSSSTQTPSSATTSGPSSEAGPAPPQASSSTSTSTADLKETTLSESVEEKKIICEEGTHDVSPRKTPHPLDEDCEHPVPSKKQKKNRCFTCKKKLGLTGFTCRCGGQFCSLHRYSDKHECNFDYKAMGEQEISQNNPQIVAQKVAKL